MNQRWIYVFLAVAGVAIFQLSAEKQNLTWFAQAPTGPPDGKKSLPLKLRGGQNAEEGILPGGSNANAQEGTRDATTTAGARLPPSGDDVLLDPALLFGIDQGPCATPEDQVSTTPPLTTPNPRRRKKKLPPPPPPAEPLNFTAGELRSVLPHLLGSTDGTSVGHQMIAALSGAMTTASVIAACEHLTKHVASADATQGAAFRRAAVASLLLAVGPSPESRPLRSAANTLLYQLVAARAKQTKRIARPQSASRAPLYLLHVSKAGGTSLCSLSHYNRCLEHPVANNCWIPGAGPVWFASFRHTEATCKDYGAVLDEHKLDLIANEGYLDGGVDGGTPELCSEMLYITMLRDPMSRVMSHMFQAGVKPAGFTREQYAELAVEERINAKPEIASNYMTRVMLGKEAYYSPLGELTTEDARKASILLGQFDVVLILEHKRWTGPVIENMLGWWNSSDLDRKHGRKSHGSRPPLTKEDEKRISDANMLDVELYKVALILFKLDLVLFACLGATPHDATADANGDGPLTCANPNRAYPKK